jgi:hypothetical protein
VVAKTKAQSMLAFKSFSPVHDVEGIKGWLQVLAAELVRLYSMCTYHHVAIYSRDKACGPEGVTHPTHM